MKKVNVFLLLSSLAVICWSFIREDKARPADFSSPGNAGSMVYIEPDSTFIMEAASSGKMEVELGNMAQQQAASQRVKDFGAMMVRDHGTANQELMALASQKNYTITDSLMAKHRRHIEHLTGLSGTEFDRAYISMMVEAHKDDIDEFEDASKKAKDADVRSWAAKNLPILTVHRDSATSIRKEL